MNQVVSQIDATKGSATAQPVKHTASRIGVFARGPQGFVGEGYANESYSWNFTPTIGSTQWFATFEEAKVAFDKAAQPVITLIDEKENRYRIEGHPSDAKWAAAFEETHSRAVESGRKPPTAWCEFSVGANNRIRSFGGEVWLGAWPQLFRNLPSSVQEGSCRIDLTAEGARLVDLAAHNALNPV